MKHLLTPGSRSRSCDRSTCHSLCGKSLPVCSARLYTSNLRKEGSLHSYLGVESMHLSTGSYIKTSDFHTVEHIKSGAAGGQVESSFLPSRLVVAVLRGMSVTLMQSIGTQWYVVKKKDKKQPSGGCMQGQGNIEYLACSQPVRVGFICAAGKSTNFKAALTFHVVY